MGLHLNKLRGDIDIIDSEIVNLLCQRGNIVLKVSEYKKEHNLSVLDSNREKEHLETLKKLNKGPFTTDEIECIFKLIFTLSKALQTDSIGER